MLHIWLELTFQCLIYLWRTLVKYLFVLLSAHQPQEIIIQKLFSQIPETGTDTLIIIFHSTEFKVLEKEVAVQL